MGTASTTKVLKNLAGTLTEETTLTTSAGAGDANKIVALNAAGILDDTLLNASAASAANKVVKQTAAGIIDPAVVNAKIISAGAADSGKLPQLDATGRIDSSVLPVGIGADTASIVTSEALAAGDLVNVWNSASTFKVRKADASTTGKEAHGFVLAAFASGATATVYFEGTNTAMTGLLGGPQFLSASVAGKTQAASPTGAGQTVQRVGFATSATTLNFDGGDPITLA